MQEELLIKIFCDVDEFCKVYKERYLLTDDIAKNQLIPKTALSLSEMMTIAIYFHHSGYRCFKWYYLKHVSKALRAYFSKILSYNRFVEIMPSMLAPLILYTIKFKVGKYTGISFIDSTPLKVCHQRRIYAHKVFKGIAERKKSSAGWFYGFKLHLVINDKGELLSFCLTAGNVDDRNPDVIDKLSKELFGKLFADSLYKAALAHLDYLEYSEVSPLVVKCIWALGDINTSESRKKLELLAQSQNQVIQDNAISQLNRE